MSVINDQDHTIESLLPSSSFCRIQMFIEADVRFWKYLKILYFWSINTGALNEYVSSKILSP